LYLFSVPAVIVAGALFIVQRFGVRLTLLNKISPEQRKVVFQFSLRSLMGVSVALAVLLAIGRSSLMYESTSRFRVLFLTAVGVLMAFLALAAVWAALGLRRPLIPTVGVILAAICVGMAVEPFDLIPRFFHLPTVAAVQVVGIVGPLLVVRSYGYRFVRCPQEHKGADSGELELG
jgi:hypothetical protein